ncbi:MAG: M28 family peptidase, partial [Clostridia bacterium]|nr:M28 family peptidase [Clostridia bacterium]
MNTQKIMKIFEDTAYVRMGGSEAELKCAEYIKGLCAEMGLKAEIEDFEVSMATIKTAKLYADGEEITCKGYMLCGSGEVEAPLYYLTNTDKYSLSLCKGKIVLVDGYMGYWMYRDIFEAGAVGFITYDGNANYVDKDIDQRELRPHVSKGDKILGVNINAKDAIRIINGNVKQAKIVVEQDEYKGVSRNVVLDMPGAIDEYIVFTAHYDSTSLSQGAYDNMSGSIGILGMAEHFSKNLHRYGLRFVWCGSEERGLLGS